MLIKVFRSLVHSGDSASLAWLKKWQGGDGLVSARVRGDQLTLEFVSRVIQVLETSELLTLLESGDPEDLVPVLYQLHRFYDTMKCETDVLLTNYCLQFLKDEDCSFDLPLVWECYNDVVPTTVVEGHVKIRSKKSKNKLVVKRSETETRFILLPCELLKGTLFASIREKGSYRYANPSSI